MRKQIFTIIKLSYDTEFTIQKPEAVSSHISPATYFVLESVLFFHNGSTFYRYYLGMFDMLYVHLKKKY